MVRENMRSPRAVLQFSFFRVGILQGGLVGRVRDLVVWRSGILQGGSWSQRQGRQAGGRQAGRQAVQQNCRAALSFCSQKVLKLPSILGR